MKTTRTWIVFAIAVLTVLALSAGVVLASQQHSTRVGGNATQLCDEMHESMHQGDADMNAMHDGDIDGMGGMHQSGAGGMGGMHTGSTTP